MKKPQEQSTDTIAVIIPTRGFVFTEVINSVIKNLEGFNHKFYFTNNLPIPECFEQPVQQALDEGADYIWLVEEDTVPPTGGLRAMLEMNADYTAIDYSLGGSSCIGIIGEDVIWTGFGCTLIKKSVFNALERPYFSASETIELTRFGNANKLTFKDRPSGYGGQDIAFGIKTTDYGFDIKPVKDMECRHLRIEGWNKIKSNWGIHTVYALEPINVPWYKGQYDMNLLKEPV